MSRLLISLANSLCLRKVKYLKLLGNPLSIIYTRKSLGNSYFISYNYIEDDYIKLVYYTKEPTLVTYSLFIIDSYTV